MELTDIELQYRIIYSVIVAGKNARFAEQAIKKLFPYNSENPFNIARRWMAHSVDNFVVELDIETRKHMLEFYGGNDMLLYNLKKSKTGNYNKLSKCLRELVFSNIDLRTCSAEELERIHGIGPKTARFFILWTRPDARCAALDVHILRWLKEKGYNAPKSTPNGKKYKELEQAFLSEADKLNITPAKLDKEIWVKYSQYGKEFQKWNPDDFTKDI